MFEKKSESMILYEANGKAYRDQHRNQGRNERKCSTYVIFIQLHRLGSRNSKNTHILLKPIYLAGHFSVDVFISIRYNSILSVDRHFIVDECVCIRVLCILHY